MQNRYVGDIGDFAKYGLLRALSTQKRLGVAWYLYYDPDEDNGDGKHTEYLHEPDQWKHLDPSLFMDLKRLVCGGYRSVAAVEKSGLLPKGTAFAHELLDTRIQANAWTPAGRATLTAWRTEWFERVTDHLADCELVFADPDNGLCLDERFRPTRREDWKRLPISEVLTLSEGRPAILYHHNTRRKGGHQEEIQYWMDRIPGCSYAFYWLRISPRTFFIVNPDRSIIDRLVKFAEEWQQAGDLIPPG